MYYTVEYIVFSKFSLCSLCACVKAELLVGFKGSSVGVLVCGPRKMREEVAKICSFGSAENLQFESISFSW